MKGKRLIKMGWWRRLLSPPQEFPDAFSIYLSLSASYLLWQQFLPNPQKEASYTLIHLVPQRAKRKIASLRWYFTFSISEAQIFDDQEEAFISQLVAKTLKCTWHCFIFMNSDLPEESHSSSSRLKSIFWTPSWKGQKMGQDFLGQQGTQAWVFCLPTTHADHGVTTEKTVRRESLDIYESYPCLSPSL